MGTTSAHASTVIQALLWLVVSWESKVSWIIWLIWDVRVNSWAPHLLLLVLSVMSLLAPSSPLTVDVTISVCAMIASLRQCKILISLTSPLLCRVKFSWYLIVGIIRIGVWYFGEAHELSSVFICHILASRCADMLRWDIFEHESTATFMSARSFAGLGMLLMYEAATREAWYLR